MKGWNMVLFTVISLAEKHNVTLVMELLNSKLIIKITNVTKPHGGRIGETFDSENFKLLYDIYHMQIG
jgi:hydroxypyruvate isomerase